MNGQEIIECLLRENPKLHYASVEIARVVTESGHKLEPGPFSMAVAPEVIRYLAKIVKPDHLTVETGAGQTTIALAGLARHHIAVAPIERETLELINGYMDRVGIPRERVTFVLESSETALSKLSIAEKLDFAFIDGCHGYPFPSLDWHFIDLQLKVGGIIGFDNTEIRSVRGHCSFLEENASYELIERLDKTSFGGDYGANFYVKLKEECREWIFQTYNRRPVKQVSGGTSPGLRLKGKRVLQRLRELVHRN
jgi:predicted O-methyltransferase YrrM